MTTRQPVHEYSGQPAGDDFTQIRGIGPGISTRLHHAGVLRFTQLASLSPEEIVAATGNLIGLTVERVAQQDWSGQARELSSAGARAELLDESSGDRLHYQTFTVELLLDEENHARRTRLVDVRAAVEEAWAGWDAARLANFITGRSGLQIEEQPQPVEAQPQPAAEEPAEPPAPQPVLSGALEIIDLGSAPPEEDPLPARRDLKHIIPGHSPFTLAMDLDLTDVQIDGGERVFCRALINAREISSGERMPLAEWQQYCQKTSELRLACQHDGLSSGLYRLEAAVTLHLDEDQLPTSPQLGVFYEGALLQVF